MIFGLETKFFRALMDLLSDDIVHQQKRDHHSWLSNNRKSESDSSESALC